MSDLPAAFRPKSGFWGQATRPIVAVARYSYQCANPRAIAAGARDIQSLWTLVRQKRPEAMRIITTGGGEFDVAATAMLHKMQEQEVERRLHATLWRSGWTARFCLATALGALVGWIGLIISGQSMGGLQSAALLVLVLTVLTLKTAEHSHRNWQIRRRRMGTMGEFLLTDEAWWPTTRARPSTDSQAAP